MLTFFIGVLSGFCLALPVGAVALMCINKTLQFGFKSGLAVGLGAAFADAFYALIAIYSLTTISNIFLQNQEIMRIIGGLCLIFISIRMIFSGPVVIETKEVVYSKWPQDIISGFVITLSNPLTYIGFIALLSYMHLVFRNFNSDLVLNFSLGAFAGSLIWWLILIEFARFLKNKVNSTFIKRSNIISGFIILVFGVLVILSSLGNN
ncbi:RhtB Putative threonine efflux protein [Candidatus Pelagibacterales bacterium]